MVLSGVRFDAVILKLCTFSKMSGISLAGSKVILAVANFLLLVSYWKNQRVPLLALKHLRSLDMWILVDVWRNVGDLRR